MPISALPTTPSRMRPTTFSPEMDAFLPAMGTFRTEANTLEVNVNALEESTVIAANAAAASQILAAASAIAALAASNATLYSGVITYNEGDAVIASDSGTYRCTTDGTIGDDPVGSVTGKWFKLTVSEPTVNIKTINFAIVPDVLYLANTTAGVLIGTLPATPVAGQRVHVGDYAGTFQENNCTLARNGKKIMSLTQDLDLNLNSFVTLIYVDETIGWRIIK